MIHFIVPRDQDFGLREYLELRGPALARHFSIIHCENLSQPSLFPCGTYVLAALDQLAPHALQLVGELEAQLRSVSPSVQVLNSVETTLFRYELLEALWRNGLNRHRAVRASEDLKQLHFPVFLRQEHQHDGSLSPLLRTRRELQNALARAIVLGYRLNELLIMEFCDTANADGIYRMYAALVIGAEIVPQFMNHSRHWIAKHSETEFTPATLLEEQAYVTQNPHERELRRICALAGVQYGRIDYAVKDGAIETWEINLNPTLARYPHLPTDLRRIRDGTLELFSERFRRAFETLEAKRLPGPPLVLHLSPPSDSKPMLRPPNHCRISPSILRRVRRFVPLFRWLAKVFSPLLVRVARFSRRPLRSATQ